ncbi:antitoxin [Saccharopolyspora erythraea]|uniref:antitoxin n=1 Tax=Saccharopolyspora erythraea TaxID=1836 RepID=UPI001BA69604|nr:antitoxin [Saccharopolyspora erythraea]QUG99835.1 antitoxin [Saccharopolyspora erythraea]
MSIMDKLKEFVGKSPDKFRQGIDKAASAADEKTGGKYRDKINRGAEQARKYVDRQGEQGGGAEKGGPGQSPGGGPEQGGPGRPPGGGPGQP